MRGAILLVGLAFAVPTFAQPSVDESLDAEGRALFAAGRAAFGAERFEDALEHFQAAYDRSRRPDLLYNVALTLDRLDRAELALETYEKYLDSVPESPYTAQANERVAALRVQVQQTPDPTPDPPTVPIVDTTTPNRDPAPIAPEPRPVQQPTVQQQAPQHVQPAEAPESRSRVPAFVLIGGGAASLVAGVALIANGLSTRKDVEDTLEQIWSPALQDDYDAASRRTITGVVLGAVGVVAAATGVLLLVLGPRDEDSIAFDVGPGSLTLRGAF